MSIIIEKEIEAGSDLPCENIINQVINEALDYVSCPYETEVSVVLTDNETIRRINREFRKLDKPTDVLSFPMLVYETPGDFTFLESAEEEFNPETGELVLGDIVVSMDKVYAQAEEYGHSPVRELAFLIAHSMLHLFGYDHIEERERIIMEEKQTEILSRLGIER